MRLVVVVLLVAAPIGCGADGGAGGGSLDGLSQDELVEAVVERLEQHEGVASASGEREALDTEYYGVTVEARMEPGATPDELTGALTELDDLGSRIDSGSEYDAALVVPGDDGVDHRLLGTDPDDAGGDADADTRTAWFQSARAALPTATITVGPGVRAVVAEPTPAAVTDAARTVAADPELGAVERVAVETDGSGNFPQGLHLTTAVGMTPEVVDVWTGVLAVVGPLDDQSPQDLYVSRSEPDESSPQAWYIGVHLNTLFVDDLPAGPTAGPDGRRLWGQVRGLLDVVDPLQPNAALVVTASADPFLAVSTDDSQVGYTDLAPWHRAAEQYLAVE